MSVKEFLKKSNEQFVDASPVLPEGVRFVTREKLSSERPREDQPPRPKTER